MKKMASNHTLYEGDIEKLQKQVNHRLTLVLTHWRKRFLFQQVLLFMPWLLIVASGLFFSLTYYQTTLAAGFIVCSFVLSLAIGKMIITVRSKQYQHLTLANFLFHLNRQFPILEESSQLLLCNKHELSLLEKLQFEKVLRRTNEVLINQKTLNYIDLTPIFPRKSFIKTVLISTSLFALLFLFSQSQWLRESLNAKDNSVLKSNKDNAALENLKTGVEDSAEDSVIAVLSKQVLIEPPAYSLANASEAQQYSESLDINALIGSEAHWWFTFSDTTKDYYLNFSNGEREKLSHASDGRFHLKKTLTSSMVYHLSITDSNLPLAEDFSLIYNIQLKADNAPKIRFISPKSTVTEFSEKANAALVSQVQIFDDFAITEVEILASIAKGSGEGVKFRDQTFKFDRSELIAGKTHYFKSWQLSELDMEPGDELYFSVLAKDNRAPLPQTTRSATKIVRWLEVGQQGISADGILIDFMPEYFKSQRQIIIETIELIEDKAELDTDKFNETSEILGVAQSSLKEKYGQYLGDESEGQQSVGVTFDDEHGTSEHNVAEHSSEKAKRPNIQVHDEHGGSNAVITATDSNRALDSGHSHETTDANNSNDISGKMAIINRYGHNHEDSDIGVMGSQDPKALMKKSLENMWQAELHLMLSQPEQALPYEQKALKLLKLAKKAERIYVKRLGFEPPPVTEQRRYKGEQKEILANKLQRSSFQSGQLSNQMQWAFKALLQILNSYQSSVLVAEKDSNIAIKNILDSREKQLSSETLAIVKTVKQGLEQQILKRPALVSTLAIVERILLKQKLALKNCQDCLLTLTAKLNQLIPDATSVPIHQIQNVVDKEPLLKSYSQFLKDSQ
jgi:hypothetical protein